MQHNILYTWYYSTSVSQYKGSVMSAQSTTYTGIMTELSGFEPKPVPCPALPTNMEV